MCNRWHERESGPFRLLEDLRIIAKPLRLSKTRVKAADFFYLNEAHKDEHVAWSIIVRKYMVEESLLRLSRLFQSVGHGCLTEFRRTGDTGDVCSELRKVMSLFENGESC